MTTSPHLARFTPSFLAGLIYAAAGGDAAVATITVATCFSECQVVHLQRSNGATGARRYRLACRGFRARPVAINYKRPLKATLSQLLVGQAFAASRCDVAASII